MNTFGNNLKRLRKAKRLTQENLAFIMNVSIGAIYKWEQDLSTPDLETLKALADFFMVSIDALIAYTPKREALAMVVEKMNEHLDKKEYEEAFKLSNKLLQEYPNSFNVLYESGLLYEQYVFDNINVSLAKDKIDFNTNRAIELLNKAMEFINDSDNPNMAKYDIELALADCYLLIEDNKKSIELLENNNYDGINDAKIASLYLELLENNDNKIKEYLSKSFVNSNNKVFESALAHLRYYEKHNDVANIGNAIDYLIYFINGLNNNEGCGYFNKFLPYFYFRKALCLYNIGNPYVETLIKAREALIKYDSLNSNTNKDIRFSFSSTKLKLISDDAGPTSKYIIDRYINDKKLDSSFIKEWEGILNEG